MLHLRFQYSDYAAVAVIIVFSLVTGGVMPWIIAVRRGSDVVATGAHTYMTDVYLLLTLTRACVVALGVGMLYMTYRTPVTAIVTMPFLFLLTLMLPYIW